jgi:hypothetical protein
MEKEKDRLRDILVAEIRASGYGSMQDINQNMQSDYVDAMKQLRETEEFQQTMSLDTQKETAKGQQFRDKQSLEREKLQAQMNIKQTELEIARENKNKYFFAYLGDLCRRKVFKVIYVSFFQIGKLHFLYVINVDNIAN